MVFRLIASQHLRADLDGAWRFFSDAGNLSVITPEDIGFRITTGGANPVYPGHVITYRVKPLFGIELTWVTEITQVVPPAADRAYFADEQRVGPYGMWHHEHHFAASAAGVVASDVVYYSLPLEPLSTPLHDLLVKPQLERIFAYRAAVLSRHFGDVEGTAPSLTIDKL